MLNSLNPQEKVVSTLKPLSRGIIFLILLLTHMPLHNSNVFAVKSSLNDYFQNEIDLARKFCEGSIV